MNREQKIDFLNRLQLGQATIEELNPLEPYGIILSEGDSYRVHGKLISNAELIQFLEPYDRCERLINGLPVIYGILIK